LLKTTEAYRQQQGTTAETLLDVGKKTMTPEKALLILEIFVGITGPKKNTQIWRNT
jgi:hypothetical protein